MPLVINLKLLLSIKISIYNTSVTQLKLIYDCHNEISQLKVYAYFCSNVNITI